MEVYEAIPWGLIAPLLAIQLLLAVIAIVDLIKIDRTNGPKWLWALIIIFINMVGPIIYFIVGRKND